MANPKDFGEQPGIPEIKLPRFSGGAVRIAIVAAIVLLVVFTSFYTLNPDEAGLVLRFGKYVRQTGPGLHLKLPLGIERVYKVEVQRQQKAEFGFRTVKSGVRTQYANRNYGNESNMLTGDLNAAVVEWVVQYRIVDPFNYTFRVRNVEDTLRDMSEAVMRRVVGDRTVNEVLTVGRAEVALEVERSLQDLCRQYETGIQVEQVVLQDVNPPDEVKASFNEVNEAQQEKEKLINQAQSEYNKVIPRAQGEALQTIQEAEGYALERINHARGDSARFAQLYEEYRKAPDVTRRRLYLETLGEVLPNVDRKVIVDADLSSVLPLLNLDADSQRGGK
jgi:membrane protease subunit HflK